MTAEDRLISAHWHLRRVIEQAEALIERTNVELVRGNGWVVASQDQLNVLRDCVREARKEMPPTVLS